MVFLRAVLFVLFVIISSCSQGQVSDTITTKDKELPQTVLSHSPLKATLYSTFLPGLGQIYNRQVWKVPIIYVAEGALIYLAITNYQGAQRFKDEYILRSNGIEAGRNPQYVNFPDQSIYNLYYAYQKNFELTIVAGTLVYILNIVDAMVYAHLFEFDISPNLSMNITPYCIPSVISSTPTPNFGVSMKFNFK